MPTGMIPLVFLVGPTASGKTDWAVKWADKNGGVIVNGDSVQIYRELNIGSAKPDFTQYPSISHYLFGLVKAPQVWTAGDYRKNALKILHKELPGNKAFVVGGSGFYIRALEKGMYPIRKASEDIMEELNTLYKSKGLEFLYKELQKKDPEHARKIGLEDRYRVLRSLAIIKSEGCSVSEIKRRFSPEKLPWPYLKIGLDISREELVKRVENRTRIMLKKGLIEETEDLLHRGFESWKPLQSVGYRESVLFLKGKLSKDALYSQIVQNTLSLAKKQKTWFQKDKDIIWYDFKADPLTVYKKIFQKK
ncbi:MAG: tRNA (adenosine(37)-N6)-dimethylallyltransferase MiaA [Bdellovibrionales bacterium]|nr:tRNA (adenosine(37)-N6)-dimethylallyltransferase MiaA [Bdellovibrionales bacterium]